MRKSIVVLVILGIAGGAGYYAYSRDWAPARWVKQNLGLSGDTRITRDVKSALSLSKRVSPFNISVQTQDSIVTLAGTVSSDDIKSLAGEIARDTAGVTEVKNEIAVDHGAQPPSEAALVNDLQIKTSILEALTRSTELAGKKIEVKVEDRKVTLTGSVDTPAQKSGAEQIARAADGVTAVANELAVSNPAAPSEPAPAAAVDVNAELAKRIRFELYETGAFDVLKMNVQVEDGNATLSGSVRSRAEQLLATFVAQTTPGVKKVVNQLQVTAAAPARR
jgi:osmotically-inducible protein OsmY